MSDQLADLYLQLRIANGSSESRKSSGNYLSWMWSEPGANSILSWIVNNVNSKCLVSLQELNDFHSLKISGRITDSCILKEAVSFKKYSISHSQDNFQQNIEALTRHQDVSMEVLGKGRQRHVNLSSQLTSCQQSLELARCHVNDHQLLLNGALQELAISLSHAGEYLHDTRNSIIQKKLEDYLHIDNTFLNSMKDAFDSLREKRLEIDNIVLSPQKLFQENVEELERIKSIFIMSERQKIDADVFLSHVKAEDLFVGSPTFNANSIQSLCEDYKRQYSSLYNTKLLPLLKDLEKYQKTDVLRGDYILKISRQKHYIRLQEKILQELLHERSRHFLLQSALKRAHTDQCKLFNLIDAFAAHVDSLHSTMERARSMVVSETNHDFRKAIDDSDRIGLCIERALCSCIGENPSSLLVTYNRIDLLAKTLANTISTQDSFINQTGSEHCGFFCKLVQGVHQMYALISLSSPTCQPSMSYQPLLHLISKVQQVMEALKEKITVLQVKEASKRRTISEDLDMSFERNIFINFFQNAAVLDDDARKLCLKANRHN